MLLTNKLLLLLCVFFLPCVINTTLAQHNNYINNIFPLVKRVGNINSIKAFSIDTNAHTLQLANPEVEIIGYNRYFHGINEKDYYYPSLQGDGIVVGVKENNIDADDVDVVKRIVPSSLAASTSDFHATTIASIIGGAGNSFLLGKGVASNATFYPSSFSNLSADNNSALQAQKVSVQNHSYGTSIQNVYSTESLSYDAQTNAIPYLVHIFSSGNRGLGASTDGLYKGITGFANITGNFKMAKNVITVGALDTNGIVASFGSNGPLYDGRIAPQLTAIGPNGTSDAAAMVTGAVAILQQQYKLTHQNNLPTSSLIRALLYNAADDIDNNGIDYKTGYGSVNIIESIKTLTRNNYIEGAVGKNENKTYNIQIPRQVGKLKVTITWNDTAATINNTKALINNIDMTIIDNNGNVFMPWCLSSYPNKDSLLKKSIRRIDTLNNAEQITIDLPTTGNYRILVNGTNIQTIQKQLFHIAYSWDTLNNLQFMYPNQAQDINTSKTKQLPISWKVAVSDTNNVRGNVDVSYNNGTTWNTIASNIKLYKQQFKWIPKDTNAIIKFRIASSIGTVTSPSIFLTTLTKIQVEYVCKDSAKISWNKHINCNSYDVFALKDGAYLEKIQTVTDTNFVIQRNVMPYKQFAVKPLSNNGLSTSRSRSLDIEQQGVDCFYTDFNAYETNPTISLTISLTNINVIDSIYFEKIYSNGLVQKSIAGYKVNNNITFDAIDNNPNAGANTYRAIIKLKNGGIIKTSTITITSNGRKNLLLFPNPIVGDQPLQYILKNTDDVFVFVLINSQGSIVLRKEINYKGEIFIPQFSKGIYFYKLLSTKNEIIQTGTIIKQ